MKHKLLSLFTILCFMAGMTDGFAVYAQKADSKGAGDKLTFTVKGVNFNMIKVEGGTFMMGAQNFDRNGANYDIEAYCDYNYEAPHEWGIESPVHSVTLSTYYIGETEVTQALWNKVMGGNHSFYEGENLPVEGVSWDEVQEFITRLNRLTGKTFCLPTEAEWEFAARGGNHSHGYKYSGSNTFEDVACKVDGTCEVKSKAPNELGLYDMTGNVCELCQDCYEIYSSDAQTNPLVSADGDSEWVSHVFRGGCWYEAERDCRVSSRFIGERPWWTYGIGFRLVLRNSSVSAFEDEFEENIYQIVEEMPTFPGGDQKLREYIDKSIIYPKEAREQGIHGKVYLNFVIEPDGSVSNVKVLRSIGGGCDEEAVRIVEGMPKWNPGKQSGKAVRVFYIIPITFQMQ